MALADKIDYMAERYCSVGVNSDLSSVLFLNQSHLDTTSQSVWIL